MKFTVGDSNGGKFNTAPEGQYVAKFLGIEEMKEPDKPLIGQDGKPMAPGMAWEFEIAEGEHKGKVMSRITGKYPTAKNMAGRLMAAVSGKYLKPGVEIDLDQHVGKLYTITVEPKENGNGTRVSTTPAPVPYTGAAGSPNAPAPAGGPPPRSGRTNAGKAGPAFWWVETNPDADPVKVEAAELRKFFDGNPTLSPRETLICPDGGSEYKPAVDYDSSLLF
jgi:hypothetical protein